MNPTQETMPTEPTLNTDYLQNGCTRAEALRTGQLHDFTHARAADNSFFIAPAAITAALWRAVAGEQPFALDHPILLQLVRLLAAAIHKNRYDRRQENLFSEITWLRVPLAGQPHALKLVCHPGDSADPVITVLLDSEEAQFEL